MSATITAPGARAGDWLLGPWRDGLWIVNALWPLVALAGGLLYGMADLFWVYLFLSASHRWLTLPLLAMDWEQIRPRRRLIVVVLAVTLAGYAVLLATGVPLKTLNGLVLVIDSWHRCAQHFGMVRLYERSESGGTATIHRPLSATNPRWLQTLVLYAFLRAIGLGAAVAGLPFAGLLQGPWLRWTDLGGVFLASWIVFGALLQIRQPRAAGRGLPTARLLYLASAAAVYGLLLLAIMRGALVWAAALYAAGLYFHAVEYLAIVSWRVDRRRSGWHGWRATVAGVWVPCLVGFVLLIGMVGWFMPAGWKDAWFGLNLLVSLLHYQFDGIIWRRPPVS